MRTQKELKQHERIMLKNIICEKTGYYIRSNCLLYQAFTRSSYSVEHGGENNEILEFIGDQVLSYYVVKLIAERCGALNSDCEYTFRIRENRFSTLKQELVSNEKLAGIIDDWGVIDFLIVGKSDYLNEIDKQIKVKADLFEAILGAIAVACKWNTDVLEKVISKMLSIDERINSIIETDYYTVQFDIENAVSKLKELAEHRGCSIPEYKFATLESLRHDNNGNPIWTCTCSVINDKTGITQMVTASSKKSAKKAAAYLVLCEHFDVQNRYGVNRKCAFWKYENGKLMPDI